MLLDRWTREPEHELFTEDDDERTEILEDRDEYISEKVFWVPVEARWDEIHKAATLPDIGPRLDKALEAIERENPEQLRGVLPQIYGRAPITPATLGELVNKIGEIGFREDEEKARDYLGSQGAMPASNELEAFARAQGFPLPRRPAGGHRQALLEVQQQFAAQGRWPPSRPPLKSQPRAYDFTAGADRQQRETRRRKRRTKEDCLAAIVAYLDQLDGRETAAQKRYGKWVSGTGRPAPSSFRQHGGWTALVAEARAIRCARVKT